MSNWIQGATANSHGQFKAKAQNAGMTTRQFAQKVLTPGSKASTTTKRQASLAQTLMGMHK